MVVSHVPSWHRIATAPVLLLVARWQPDSAGRLNQLARRHPCQHLKHDPVSVVDRHVGIVVSRGQLDNVERDDICPPPQFAQDPKQVYWSQPARLRCSRGRGEAGVEHVDVHADVQAGRRRRAPGPLRRP